MLTLQFPENELISLYLQGKTLQDLADFYKIKTSKPIKRILLKNNINLRRKGTNRAKNKLKIDIDYFRTIDSHEKAYWLGIITSDGHVTKDGLKVSLISKDYVMIFNFKKAIGSEHKIMKENKFDKRTNKTYTSYTIQIGCKNFVENIVKLGVDYYKSYMCEFPNISEEYYSSYIRGLFDGDGSVCYFENKTKISLIATENILNFIQQYLITNFNFSKTKFSIVASKDDKNICKLYVNSCADITKFLSFIYEKSNDNSRLERKYNYYERLLDGSRPILMKRI